MILTRKQAFKELFIFSLPMIFGQLGLMLIGTGDMIIAGQVSRECLAAIGLAISIANPIQISLLGFQFAISPILAKKMGEGENIQKYFWTVIIYSLCRPVVSGHLPLSSISLVPLFGYGDKMNGLISEYLFITSFSSLGLNLYQGMKEYYQAQEKAITANLIALICVGVNLFLNYAFVFGKFNFPRLDEAGLAWASLIVRLLMGLVFFVLGYRLWRHKFQLNVIFLKELIKLGAPITLSFFFEILAFCSVTLFVGKFAEIQTAANNLALNLGSLAFMIPLSISGAVAVKVGHAYGEKKWDQIKVYSKMGLAMSFGFSLVMGSLFYLTPEFILSLYTDDILVLDWAKKLLFWVACFQLFDGAQVTIAGILRGLSLTKAASFTIFIAYRIIGIPLGYFLGFYTKLESQGFWIGLALSLMVVAIMLAIILRKRFKILEMHTS